MKGPLHGIDVISEKMKVLPPCERLIDVGPGIRPFDHFKAGVHLCVEPHWEYVQVLMGRGYPVVYADALTALPLLRNFEVILFLDVLEHMDKDLGHLVLREAVSAATRQIVVFTPLGFMKQEPGEKETDPWGYSGWEWQIHKSGWLPEDFSGWEITVDRGFHKGHGAFLAVFTK